MFDLVSPTLDIRKDGRTDWEILRARSLVNVPKEGDLGELGDADGEFPSMTKGLLLVSTRRVGVLAMVPES